MIVSGLCVRLVGWSFLYCQGALTGPGVPQPHWDITRDGFFDLHDFAEFQNGMHTQADRRKGYRTCCVTPEDCLPIYCDWYGP
jgi:hypothetical protein